jgi:hypothetical protein
MGKTDSGRFGHKNRKSLVSNAIKCCEFRVTKRLKVLLFVKLSAKSSGKDERAKGGGWSGKGEEE